jgi:ABC-type branched-subunit amino acid transport system substrate-binding protein
MISFVFTAASAMAIEPIIQHIGLRRLRAVALAVVLAGCWSDATPGADLLVAQVAPVSGPRGALASEYRDGARLYFDSVNARGGINGAALVLEARDGADDPASTRRQATDFIARKPIAFIGTVGTVNVASVLTLLEASQTALLGPLVDAAGVDETGNHTVFHIRPNERQEIEAIVARLDSLGLKRITVCYHDRSATDEGMRAIRSPKDLQVINCGGDSARVEAAVSAVIGAGAQAVVFAGRTEDATAFISTLREKGSFAMVVMSSSIDARKVSASLPASAKSWLAAAEVFPNPNTDGRMPSDAVVREFSKLRAASKLPVPASSASLAGFVSAKILVEALRRAGERPTAADVLRSLRALQQYDVGGMTFDFSRVEPASAAYTRLGVVDGRGAALN